MQLLVDIVGVQEVHVLVVRHLAEIDGIGDMVEQNGDIYQCIRTTAKQGHRTCDLEGWVVRHRLGGIAGVFLKTRGVNDLEPVDHALDGGG